MVVFDVPAARLIGEIAKDLQQQGVKQPEWTGFAKSGRSRERSPDNPQWFYTRMASVLYRVFKDGPLGTESLRTYYGGRKNRGTKKSHFYKASGKVVRTCLQELEKQGMLKKGKKGRVVSPKGHSYLVKKAKQVAALLAEEEKRAPARAVEKRVEKGAEELRVEQQLRTLEQKGRKKEPEKRKEKKKEKKEKGAE